MKRTEQGFRPVAKNIPSDRVRRSSDAECEVGLRVCPACRIWSLECACIVPGRSMLQEIHALPRPVCLACRKLNLSLLPTLIPIAPDQPAHRSTADRSIPARRCRGRRRHGVPLLVATASSEYVVRWLLKRSVSYTGSERGCAKTKSQDAIEQTSAGRCR